jgi:hypothetical protein
MAKPKRTDFQREHDLESIAAWYLTGIPQGEIARRLNISRGRVSQELKEIQERWLKSSVRNFDAAKAEQLAKIDKLESEYWAAWIKSGGKKLETITETTHEVPDNSGESKPEAKQANEPKRPLLLDAGGNPVWKPTAEVKAENTGNTSAKFPAGKTKEKTWHDVGDPRFLQGILNCIERRCALLGLDKPRLVNLNVDGTIETFTAVPTETLEKELNDIITRTLVAGTTPRIDSEASKN